MKYLSNKWTIGNVYWDRDQVKPENQGEKINSKFLFPIFPSLTISWKSHATLIMLFLKGLNLNLLRIVGSECVFVAQGLFVLCQDLGVPSS